jgi:uncharacterized protein YaaN involved in tellurite resistance
MQHLTGTVNHTLAAAITSAVAATLNLLVMTTICFYVAPMISRQEKVTLQNHALNVQNQQLILENNHLLKSNNELIAAQAAAVRPPQPKDQQE